MNRFSRASSAWLIRAAGLAAIGLTAHVTALAQASAPPDGSAAIHYSRCDGNYAGWGLHSWKDSGAAVLGIDWQKPMKPAGTDDFGAYFHLPVADYGGGKVNYILHKGDTKDQGGQDMAFDPGKSKEIWVNNGDKKIYTSLDDAKAARAANPCK